MRKPRQVRQGDVLITEISATAKVVGEKQERGKPITLALGEATGHHHTLDIDNADWWKGEGEQVVLPNEEARLKHQEHRPVRLRKGRKHKVRIQSAYDPVEVRRVAD